MASQRRPEILAPAGDESCFLAALAAGADAIYLGLKHFSARMEAGNFGLAQLGRLAELAHQKDCRVYVAMNVLIKPQETEAAFRLARRLATQVDVDGLIIQDPGMIPIARQADFRGSLALSTLANVSSPLGLRTVAELGVQRVIVPRELSLDELKMMGESCPAGVELECFVQGALCYCVSGRCYWSSYMGGKSGLRGRCVQPCRRQYRKIAAQAKKTGGGERYFSCQDLELGELAHTLLDIPNLVSWKIEGRKKGPHYVYHAVRAYTILRDNAADGPSRRLAHEILQMALGRPGVQARFLAQKKHFPMAPHGQTCSGLLAGHARIRQDGTCVLKPHFPLLPNDRLRIGVEDEPWHSTVPVSRAVPKSGTLTLRLPKHKTPGSGTPVYLIDRRDPQLRNLLARLAEELGQLPPVQVHDVTERIKPPMPAQSQALPGMVVSRHSQREPGYNRLPRTAPRLNGLWLNAGTAGTSRAQFRDTSFWLPPVIWPDGENEIRLHIDRLWRAGARNFVCNAPWQRSCFPASLPADAMLAAGPFCNLANAMALDEMRRLGFSAAFVSPEPGAADILALPKLSPLPLGIVLSGYWPVGLSRFGLAGIDVNEPFASPKGEVFWARNHGGTIWIYPAWPLDLCDKRKELIAAGYSFFAILTEKTPARLPAQKRPGLFNWNGNLI